MKQLTNTAKTKYIKPLKIKGLITNGGAEEI